jgi:NAD(P)-dependent dehydrogenase (short-subunit alcohol dehydrogenase family)
MERFKGKTVLITGGSTGIGRATGQRFLDEGARVYLAARRQGGLDAAVRELGGDVIAVAADVSDLDDLDRLFATIEERGDRLDVVFANAGGGDRLASITDVTPQSYDYTFGVNVKGTIFTVQKALPLLNDGGAIVVTGSTSASRGTPAFGMYSASKAALRQLVRTWASELASRRVRVNLVVPGPTDTPGLRGIAPEVSQQAALLEYMANRVPLGRVANSLEIANAVLFLASDESSFTTGSELFADGGEVQVFTD